jgi:FixJ family two-component response regulator
MITIARGEGAGWTTWRAVDVGPTVFVMKADACGRDSLLGLVQAAGWRAQTCASTDEFLAQPRLRVPSCLVVDLAMAEFDGLDVQRRVSAERPETSVVFTGCTDIRFVVQAIKAGPVEVLATSCRQDVLVDAIDGALERSQQALERQARARDLHECYGSLTPREREVMVLVVSGLLNKQVAGELGISEITVKAHRGQVMRKMKAGSLPALVHMVGDLGLPTTLMA